MGRPIHKSILGPREQGTRIAGVCPGFNYRVRNGVLIGRGTIKPGPLTDEYDFSLEYKRGRVPTVRILRPPIYTKQGGKVLGHTYEKDKPCVFRPKFDWSVDKVIANTVIPWLALWLQFYEVWLATGKWLGGGEHPSPTEGSKGGQPETYEREVTHEFAG